MRGRLQGIRRNLYQRWKVILIMTAGLLGLAVGVTLAVPQLRDRAENWYNHTFHAETLATSDAYERTRGRETLPAILAWTGDSPTLAAGYSIYAVSYEAASGTTYLNIESPDDTALTLARQPVSPQAALHFTLPTSAPQEAVQFGLAQETITAALIYGDWATGDGWQPDAPLRRLRWAYARWLYELTIYAPLDAEAVIALVSRAGIGG